MHRFKLYLVLLALMALVIVGCRPVEVDVPDSEGIEPGVTDEFLPTEEPTMEATAEATAEMTEEATAEVTDEPTPEATEETAGAPVEEEVETTTAQTVSTDVRIITFGLALAQAIQTGMVVGAENVDLEAGEWTVFIPDNEALGDLSEDDLTALITASDTQAATDFFGCYIVEGALAQSDLADAGTVTAVNGEELEITTDEDGSLWINGEVRITGVISTANGTIYIVDGVFCQPSE